MRRPSPRVLLGLMGLGAVLLAGAGYAAMGHSEATGLTVFWPAPAFALTDQLDRPVRSEDLRGTVVVADFIYTSCRDICPLLSLQMQGLQNRLRQEGLAGRQVQLLSFTVDPERDTTTVLNTYAAQHQADPSIWRFLTGPKDMLVPLIVDGFHLGVGVLPPEASTAVPDQGTESTADYAVMHSGRFVLIDQKGQVRANYDGQAFDSDRVVQDIRQLLR